VLRTDTFLTWEEAAYSWVKFANLSPGKHTVRWEWYEPGGALYAESEELSLQGNGSPSYTVWSSITLTLASGVGYFSKVEPSFDQPKDRTGDWQVKVYFDGASVLTEDFKIIKAPWAPVAQMSVAPGEHHVAVDPVRNLIYVTNNMGEPPPITFGDYTWERPYRVYVFDGNTYQLLSKVHFVWGTAESLSVPLYPGPIVVNPTTGSVYVSAGDVYITHPGSGNFLLVPAGTIGGVVGRLAVNSANGYVYVDRWDKGRVTVIGTGPTLPGEVPHLNLLFPGNTGAMAVNPKTNRVYIVGDGMVYVLDSATNEIVATIPNIFAAAEGLVSLITTIDVNPETNRVYVSRSTVADEQTTVIDGETNTVITTFDMAGGRLRVNPITNRIYIIAEAIGQIRILDGSTNMMIDRVLLPSGLFPEQTFAVNPVTHKLYFTTGGDLLELLTSEQPVWEKPGLVYVMSDEPGPAGVVISEVELNPVKKPDTLGNQWVKLYNTGASEVDISGWTITSTRPSSPLYGLTAHIPPGTKIAPGGYYTVESPDVDYPWCWLLREMEVVTLRDSQGRLVSWTPELTDKADGGTPETWQR
jgi:DNA-binding beta-propeller fold protein YncE